MTEKVNLAASVMARLLKKAKADGDDHQTLLSAYCFERFLYRLGVSPLRDRFVLKGAIPRDRIRFVLLLDAQDSRFRKILAVTS